MSEEELQLLITLDDPGGAPEEDTFNHVQARNTLEYWLGQLFPAGCWFEQRAGAATDSDACNVTFGQGDWTCTLSRLTATTEPSSKKFDIDVCTITHWKDREIVEEKVFYDLAGMQYQFGVM